MKQIPEVYLDVYVQSVKVGNRIRCKPLGGQVISDELWVECSKRIRCHFPVGTIFKADVRKVQPEKRRSYLATFHRNELLRAIEYFEHNNALQHYFLKI
jgi:hypothetical protein